MTVKLSKKLQKIINHGGRLSSPFFYQVLEKPIFVNEEIWLTAQYLKGLELVCITGGGALDGCKEYYFFDRNKKIM